MPISNPFFVRGGWPVAATAAVLLVVTGLCGGRSVHAQEPGGTPPPLQPAETPLPRVAPRVPTPAPVAEETPAATPTPTPRVRAPKAAPTPSADEPVAVVNGAPVYRPLFRSIVNDPVDRALVLLEYRHRGMVLPAGALEQAVRNHTKSAFGDQNALIDKLHDAGASFDDYRTFVAEEVELNAMLAVVSKGGRTDADRKTLRDTWMAELRKKASVNKTRKA